MNQKKIGVIVSYINLVAGMLVNVFLTPLLINTLGDMDYSLYKVMQSFSGSLTIFNLGISTIVARNIVKFNCSEESSKEDRQNSMALSVIASLVITIFVVIVGFVMHGLIPTMYGDAYVGNKIDLGQNIFAIFVAASALHILTDAFTGSLIGHERFAVASSISLFKTLFKLIVIVFLMKAGATVFSVVLVDLAIALMVFVFTVLYSVLKLREYPVFNRFDVAQLKEMLAFGFAILLQSFVNQVNNNVDNVLLGTYVEHKEIITMYSSALSIYCIYNSLISVISNYFLPKATKLITQKASGEQLTNFVIFPGRFQAAIAVACIFGFALFGRDFIVLWIGQKYLDAYWVVLLLMVPVTVPLVENAMISILDASLKRTYRSVVLVIMAICNVAVSIFLIRVMGFWGAAVGTCASLMIGHGVLMNIYYHRVFHIEVKRMFVSIFKGILPAGIVALMLCLPVAYFIPIGAAYFAAKCLFFLLIYGAFLMLFGFNTNEKRMLKSTVKGLLGCK